MTADEQTLWAKLVAFRLDDENASFKFSHRLARENGWSVEDGGFLTSEVIYPDEKSPEGLEFTLLSWRCGYQNWEATCNAANQLQRGFGFGYTNAEDEVIVSGKSEGFNYYLDPLLF